MQTFKTDKKIYQRNELKSWGWYLTLISVYYFVSPLLYNVSHNTRVTTFFLLLFYKAREMFLQYRVTEIRVDHENNQLLFMLHSIMTGEKIKIYELSQAKSELKQKSNWLTKLFVSPVRLDIRLPKRYIFQITDRYGFSAKTLADINQTLMS